MGSGVVFPLDPVGLRLRRLVLHWGLLTVIDLEELVKWDNKVYMNDHDDISIISHLLCLLQFLDVGVAFDALKIAFRCKHNYHFLMI